MGLRGSLLHIGAGGASLPPWAEGATETTVDIDPIRNPDIIASMVSLGDIGKYDFVYSCHCLEHVTLYEGRKALKEMLRVLVDGGTAIVIVPDLADVKPTHDMVYDSDAGPITGLDILYGKLNLIDENPYMAHKNGFTVDTLKAEFGLAGFQNITGTLLPELHSIMVTGEK